MLFLQSVCVRACLAVTQTGTEGAETLKRQHIHWRSQVIPAECVRACVFSVLPHRLARKEQWVQGCAKLILQSVCVCVCVRVYFGLLLDCHTLAETLKRQHIHWLRQVIPECVCVRGLVFSCRTTTQTGTEGAVGSGLRQVKSC